MFISLRILQKCWIFHNVSDHDWVFSSQKTWYFQTRKTDDNFSSVPWHNLHINIFFPDNETSGPGNKTPWWWRIRLGNGCPIHLPEISLVLVQCINEMFIECILSPQGCKRWKPLSWSCLLVETENCCQMENRLLHFKKIVRLVYEVRLPLYLENILLNIHWFLFTLGNDLVVIQKPGSEFGKIFLCIVDLWEEVQVFAFLCQAVWAAPVKITAIVDSFHEDNQISQGENLKEANPGLDLWKMNPNIFPWYCHWNHH